MNALALRDLRSKTQPASCRLDEPAEERKNYPVYGIARVVEAVGFHERLLSSSDRTAYRYTTIEPTSRVSGGALKNEGD